MLGLGPVLRRGRPARLAFRFPPGIATEFQVLVGADGSGFFHVPKHGRLELVCTATLTAATWDRDEPVLNHGGLSITPAHIPLVDNPAGFMIKTDRKFGSHGTISAPPVNSSVRYDRQGHLWSRNKEAPHS